MHQKSKKDFIRMKCNDCFCFLLKGCQCIWLHLCCPKIWIFAGGTTYDVQSTTIESVALVLTYNKYENYVILQIYGVKNKIYFTEDVKWYLKK